MCFEASEGEDVQGSRGIFCRNGAIERLYMSVL